MRFYIGAVGDWSYANATEIVDFVRFPHDRPLESSAEGADAAVAGWVIEDSQGVYNVNGLRPAWVDEDDVDTAPDDSTTGIRIWSGFVTTRRWTRAEGYRQGAARLIEVDLFDINTLLKRHAIVTADGKRPAELDSARISWLLGGVLDGIVFDNGLLDYSGPGIMLDEADYRDNYAVDVLGDAGAISAKDFYVIWDSSAAAGEEVTLVYEQRSATQRVASLGISNVRADQNLDDIWEPSWDSVLERSPENVYSGVDLVYLGGNRVYLQNPTTLANFLGSGNQSLDLVVSSSRIGKLTTATSQALLQLQIHSMEKDIIETRLFLPVSRVNWVMAGQSIVVRYTHFDGYETDTTMKVLRKSVIHPWPDRRRFYEVALRLANGEAGAPVSGGGGGGPPPPDDFPPPPDEGECVPSDTEIQTTATSGQGGATRANSYPDYNGSTGYGFDGNYGPGYGDPGPTGYETYWDFWADNNSHWYCWYALFFPSTTFTAIDMYWGSGGATQVHPTWFSVGTGGVSDQSSGTVIPHTEVGTFDNTDIPPEIGHLSADGWTRFELDAPATGTFVLAVWDHGVFGPGLDVHGVHSFREMGVYECISTPSTPPAAGQWIAAQEKVGDGDGATDSWSTLWPFADGSLRVWYDTVNQTPAIASYDGVAGTFTMQGAALDGQQVFVLYQGR